VSPPRFASRLAVENALTPAAPNSRYRCLFASQRGLPPRHQGREHRHRRSSSGKNDLGTSCTDSKLIFSYQVKLIDFGSAVCYDARFDAPFYDRFFGTLNFASSGQCTIRPSHNSRTDQHISQKSCKDTLTRQPRRKFGLLVYCSRSCSPVFRHSNLSAMPSTVVSASSTPSPETLTA
jgi:hypothetical protein